MYLNTKVVELKPVQDCLSQGSLIEAVGVGAAAYNMNPNYRLRHTQILHLPVPSNQFFYMLNIIASYGKIVYVEINRSELVTDTVMFDIGARIDFALFKVVLEEEGLHLIAPDLGRLSETVYGFVEFANQVLLSWRGEALWLFEIQIFGE